MKNYELSINEQELFLILQAVSMLKHEAEIDKTGIVNRKMPEIENQKKYISAIENIQNKLMKLNESGLNS